jgi:hypothetical protein
MKRNRFVSSEQADPAGHSDLRELHLPVWTT